MVTERGAIVWDDYPGIPDVYRHLTELAEDLEPAPFHISGTRLVVYSRRPLLDRNHGVEGLRARALDRLWTG